MKENKVEEFLNKVDRPWGMSMTELEQFQNEVKQLKSEQNKVAVEKLEELYIWTCQNYLRLFKEDDLDEKINSMIKELKGENAELKDLYNKSIEREIFLIDEERKTYFKNVELKKEITALKAELEKKLKNFIGHEFKVGDVLWYIRCDKVEKFIVYEAKHDGVFYYVNEYGVDVDEYKLFATKQEAEEALKKLNKE